MPNQEARCDVEWNYIHDGSVAIVTASLTYDEGKMLSYDVIGVMKKRGSRVALEIFRPECRPEKGVRAGSFRDYQSAMQYIHDHCLAEISNFMSTRIP